MSYGLDTLDLSILLGYFVIVAAIGVIASRLVKSREDFTMGGRRFGKLLTIMFTFGAGTHADSAVGVSSQCYQTRSLAGFWYQGVLTILMSLLLLPFFGRLTRELLPSGFRGLMVACVLASIMDNLSVFMISFAGIYTDSIHPRLVPESSEAALLRVNRWSSIVFALIVIPAAYVFTDVPQAMRFTFKTVPLMGIAFFMAVLWPRANRQGAFMSFFAAWVGRSRRPSCSRSRIRFTCRGRSCIASRCSSA